MNIKILDKLVRISRESIDLPDGENKHFSFLIRRNKIVSMGWNLGYKTCGAKAARFNYRFNGIHSEWLCIKNFCFPVNTLPKFTLVNVRINKRGELRMSKPCHSCEKLLKYFEIGDIVYSTNNGFKEF